MDISNNSKTKYYCIFHKQFYDKIPKRKCIKRMKMKGYKGYFNKKCKYLVELDEGCKN